MYVIYFFDFHFQYNSSYNLIKTETLVFRTFFEYAQLFLDDNEDKGNNWLSNTKSSVSGSRLALAWFLPI